MSLTPFDFLNAINFSKENLIKDEPSNEKFYNPFIVNRGLSYFPDTVMYANELNQRHFIDKKLQFDFYLNSISKKKRFSKWSKKDETTEFFEAVKSFYGFSDSKTQEAMRVLTKEQLQRIKEMQYKGGR